MIPTLFVEHLTPAEILTLEQPHRNHPKPNVRRRAQIILLNNQGMPANKIRSMLNINRQTVSLAINAWKKCGLCGLFDKPRTGRPKKLSPKQEVKVINMIHNSPRSLKSVVASIETELGVTVSLSILKRLCKKAGLT